MITNQVIKFKIDILTCNESRLHEFEDKLPFMTTLSEEKSYLL